MLTGSMAMAVYAEPRMTRDIDLVVECRGVSAERWIELFGHDCYISEEAVRLALATGGMFNIIHLESIAKADLIVRAEKEYRRVEFARRRTLDLDGIPVQVVAPEDLFLSKLVWWMEGGSELQRRDLEALRESRPDLDLDYITRWAAELGASAKLGELEP
jgi:hypothetical protein